MTIRKHGPPAGDATWWMAAVATTGTLIIVIGIGLASFIGTISPVAVEILAIGMLLALGLVSLYVVTRSLSNRP